MNADEIRKLVDKCLEKCNAPRIPIYIQFNDRFTRTLGQAKYFYSCRFGIISISTKLWKLATRYEQENTVVHETCHIIDASINGTMLHNSTWKSLHWKCGFEPKRCHSIDVKHLKRKVARYDIKCGCGIKKITAHRRTKILKGHNYRCLDCNKLVRLALEKNK